MRRRGILPALVLLACAASASALPPDAETAHVVEPGETLNGIANRAGVSSSAIARANGLEPPYIVRIGQTLKIPRGATTASRSIPARSGSASASPGNYIVQPGETLGGIANREQVPRVLIIEANNLKPPYLLQVGQELVIPRTRHHTVKPGETGFAIAMEYAVPWDAIAVANGMEPGDALKAGQNLLIPTVFNRPDPAPAAPAASPAATPAVAAPESRFGWPLAGEVRRGFRTRASGNYHDGLDIVAPKGSAVRAADKGTVIYAGPEESQFGNLVVIDHGDGWHSAYGSLGRVTVRKGHTVARGERVGLVGDTSITKRTELHFELRRNNTVVDPLDHLPGR